jgi:glycerol-3-phosphate dehydrogenase
MNKKIQIAIPCKNMFQSIYFYVGSILYHAIYLFFAEKNKIKFDFPYFVHNKDLRNWFPFISDKYTSGVIYEDGQFNDAQMNLNLLLTATLPRNTDQKNKIKFEPGNILNQA